MEFLDSLKQVKENWQPYKKWEKEQDDREFQRQDLHKRTQTPKEDLEKAGQYGRTVVDAINIMDQYSINKAEDVEIMTKPLEGFFPQLGAAVMFPAAWLLLKTPLCKKIIKKYESQPIKIPKEIETELLAAINHQMGKDIKFIPKSWVAKGLIVGIPAVLGVVAGTAYGCIKARSYEKEGSRIARFQAREVELKDPRHFMIHTKEQIEKGKEIAKTLPEIPDKDKDRNSLNPIKILMNSFKSVKSLTKDYENYTKWKAGHIKYEDSKSELFNKMNLTPEQVEKAKKDRDNITGVIKKVEINSQNYLSNVEMAMNTVLNGEFVVGAAAGLLITGAITLFEKLKGKKANSLEKTLQTPDMKSVAALMAKMTIPVLIPTVLIGTTAIYSIKAMKEAAKIGRFRAKQDLLNDPHNFIAYNDDQSQQAKELKAPKKEQKGFFGKLKEDVIFFKQFKKDYEKYEKYQETQAKDDIKLREALKKVDVTPEQAQEAKSLQKHAFYAFEKMDEKTQRYADDVEGAADIVKTFVQKAGEKIGAFATLFLVGRTLMRGKIPTWETVAASVALAVVNVPVEIKAIQIKKEAAKIGVMTAMKDLDDPRNFVDKDAPVKSQSAPPKPAEAKAVAAQPAKTSDIAGFAKKFFKKSV